MATACEGGCVYLRAGRGALSPAGAAPDQGRGHHPGLDSCPCTHPSAPAIDSIDALPRPPPTPRRCPVPLSFPQSARRPHVLTKRVAAEVEGSLATIAQLRVWSCRWLGPPCPAPRLRLQGVAHGATLSSRLSAVSRGTISSLHPPTILEVEPACRQSSTLDHRPLPATACTPLPVSSLPRPSANFRLCRYQSSPSLCLCLHLRDPCHCRIFSLGRDSVSSCSVPPSSD